MIKSLVEQLEAMNGARFISVTYRAKESGELARHTLGVLVNYLKVCERDIEILNLRLRNAAGIEKVVIQGQINSLKESINAAAENRYHVLYTKPGLYRNICPGVQINLNDNTLELKGFQHKKVVIESGIYRQVKHRSPETALKAQLRKSLMVGRYRTFALDPENINSCRINGSVIEFY